MKFFLALCLTYGASINAAPTLHSQEVANLKATRPASTASHQATPPVAQASVPHIPAPNTSSREIEATSAPSRHVVAPEEDGTEFWPLIRGYKIKVMDSILALLGLATVVFTGLTWRATRHMVLDGRDSAQRQLRAYVLVRDVTLVNSRRIGGGYDQFVRIALKNYGNTPASQVKYWVHIDTAKYPLATPVIRPPGEEARYSGDLPPGGELVISAELPLLDTGPIQDGKSALIVFGHFSYHDGFMSERSRPFCYLRSGERWSANGEFEQAQYGNSGD